MRGLVWLVGYIATIFAANWAVDKFGIVSVGFGYKAPAAVYFVGLAFTLRDLTQDALGTRMTAGAILVGAGLSALVSPSLALASGLAFGFSEGADLLVYTPLRERRWLTAVLASNAVGLCIDSLIFLWLAFHSLAFLPGQLIGKSTMTLLAILILPGVRGVVLSRNASSALAE